MSADFRAGKFDVIAVRGADMAFTVTATSGGSAVDLSAATIAGELYASDGSVADTMTDAVSGAGSNIITLSFTDTETTALTGDSYPWTLWVTRGGDKRPWLAGRVRVVDSSNGVTATNGDAITLTVDSDVNVSIDVLAVGGSGASGTVDTSGTPVANDIARFTDADTIEGLSYSEFRAAINIEDGADVTDATNVAAAGAVMLSTAPVTVSGTSDTLASTDNGKFNVYSNASAVTVTIPTDASDDLPDGFECVLFAAGAGGLSLSTSGITLVGSSPTTTAAQNASIYVKKTSTADTWIVVAGSSGAGGGVDTSGTPVANDIARFTDADTIEGRSYAELLSDLSLDSSLTTFALPDSTTISTFGATLVDDTSAQAALATLRVAPATVTGTTDTLAAGDDATVILYTAAGAVTVTLANITTGFECVLVCLGAGGLSVAAGGMSYANSFTPKLTVAQGEALYVKQTAASTFIILGGTAT